MPQKPTSGKAKRRSTEGEMSNSERDRIARDFARRRIEQENLRSEALVVSWVKEGPSAELWTRRG